MEDSVLCTLKAVDKHIEGLENDLRYVDPIFGADCGELQRFEYIGELKRERELLVYDLKLEAVVAQIKAKVYSFEGRAKGADVHSVRERIMKMPRCWECGKKFQSLSALWLHAKEHLEE